MLHTSLREFKQIFNFHAFSGVVIETPKLAEGGSRLITEMQLGN